MESDYFYCLQADYAIRKRLNFDCFGDGAVYDGIQKALNESKENFHKFAKPQKTVRYTDWKILCTPVRTYGRSAKAVIKNLRTEMCRLRFPQLKAIMNLMQGKI